MPKLYSYRIATDHGSAPNPFGGICTLNICKPAIRRTAQINDWIVATGSSVSPIGDISKKLVYAMKITDKMSMKDYDKYARRNCPIKTPDWKSNNWKRMAGDSIYNFRKNPPSIRKSVHDESNRKRDLSGEFTLLSKEFYYFGDNPHLLPKSLHPIICIRGHRSKSNEPYIKKFEKWILGRGLKKNRLYGKPIEPLKLSKKNCCC